jgi:hypothetical protein
MTDSHLVRPGVRGAAGVVLRPGVPGGRGVRAAAGVVFVPGVPGVCGAAGVVLRPGVCGAWPRSSGQR